MKLYVIAGEASGDMHAANLVHELRLLDTGLQVRAWGGDRLEAEGAELVKHYRELAFMGFTEVVMNLRTILKNIDTCKKDIASWKPDVVLLVDYPGFNLRIADYAKGLGIKVVYYISPQLWAWKKSRIKIIERAVDLMMVILPFEKDFYAENGLDVEFVGHPLLDEIARLEKHNEPPLALKNDRPVIALLPGSRKQEVERMLPVMLDAAAQFDDHQVVVAGAPGLSEDYYQKFLGTHQATLISGRTYDILRVAHGALVTSGTATLETALFGVPEVVCYKGGAISYVIGKQLIDIDFISLVNLIMGREIVKELIQAEFNRKNVAAELEGLLADGNKRSTMIQELKQLKKDLGGSGASKNAAELLWKSHLDNVA